MSLAVVLGSGLPSSCKPCSRQYLEEISWVYSIEGGVDRQLPRRVTQLDARLANVNVQDLTRSQYYQEKFVLILSDAH